MRDDLTLRRDTISAARGFEDAHSAIDGAIGFNAALLTHLLEVRRRCISGVAGQSVVESMIGGLSTLAIARKQLIEIHDEAGDLGRSIGIVVRSEGGGNPKPPVIEQETALEPSQLDARLRL